MKCYVRLMILSDSLSSHEISIKIGALPDEVWALGDKRKNTSILEKENGWVVHSKKENTADLEEHIYSIQQSLRGVENEIFMISNESGCDVQLSCVIYHTDMPPLYFSKELIIWLNSIGASLDLDLYSFSQLK